MFRNAVACAFLALVLATFAFAHHPSGAGSSGGAGPIVTIPGTTLEQGQSAAAIVFEFQKFNPLSDAQLTVPGHPHSLDAILAPSLVYSYGITNDLMLSLRIPYVRRTNLREGHIHGGVPEIHELGDSAGVGDLSVLGQYRFYMNRPAQFEAALLLGIKIPTGDTRERTNDGERFEAEFQPGSGSWDGLFGFAVTKRTGSWSFDGNILYVLATEGTQQTDLGDRLQYNVAVSYRLVGGLTVGGAPMHAGAFSAPMYHGGPKAQPHRHAEPPPTRGPALDLIFELNGEWHARQEIGSVKDPNSGGNVIFLSPGIRFSQDAWSSFVSFGFPIVSDMNGLQAEPAWRILTGATVRF